MFLAGYHHHLLTCLQKAQPESRTPVLSINHLGHIIARLQELIWIFWIDKFTKYTMIILVMLISLLLIYSTYIMCWIICWSFSPLFSARSPAFSPSPRRVDQVCELRTGAEQRGGVSVGEIWDDGMVSPRGWWESHQGNMSDFSTMVYGRSNELVNGCHFVVYQHL